MQTILPFFPFSEKDFKIIIEKWATPCDCEETKTEDLEGRNERFYLIKQKTKTLK